MSGPRLVGTSLPGVPIRRNRASAICCLTRGQPCAANQRTPSALGLNSKVPMKPIRGGCATRNGRHHSPCRRPFGAALGAGVQGPRNDILRGTRHAQACRARRRASARPPSAMDRRLSVAGSGTAAGVRKPRISPPGKPAGAAEWMLKYACPLAMADARAASAAAGVPPCAMTKAGL